jgi:hypothetical protein
VPTIEAGSRCVFEVVDANSAGLSVEDTAALLGLGKSTVWRSLQHARALADAEPVELHDPPEAAVWRAMPKMRITDEIVWRLVGGYERVSRFLPMTGSVN